jgi:methylglutaconyl-CoA hydratase
MINVTINRPERRNAIGVEMLDQFRSVFESIHHDPSARVMIIQSDVPGVFCAGADLKVAHLIPFSP